MSEVKSVARCIFPEGKAVLAAYDADGKFLLGVTIKTASVSKWAMAGVSAADRRRMEREYAELKGGAQ